MDGPDIEVGTGDSKMKRINLFPAFTKASERFRKIKQDYNTALCVMFGGCAMRKIQTNLCRGSFQREVMS